MPSSDTPGYGHRGRRAGGNQTTTRRHRLSDQRPWWDTFPWWGMVILAILVWMAFKILTDDDYELAWTRI